MGCKAMDSSSHGEGCSDSWSGVSWGPCFLGALPGAAEPGATDKMGAAAAGEHHDSNQQLGAHLRELYQPTAEAGGFSEL